MSLDDNVTEWVQPTCNSCGQDIDWNKKLRAKLNWRGPLNMDGTVHNCKQQGGGAKQQGQKTYYSAPNPSGYTGNSADYVNKKPQEPNDNMALLKEVQKLRSDIEQMKIVIQQMHQALTDYMRDDPVMRSLSRFTADMLTGQQFNNAGFKTADQVKEQDIRGRYHIPNENIGMSDDQIDKELET